MVYFMTLLVAFSILPVSLCQKCGKEEITPPRTTFWSPTYPVNYRNNMECEWRVSVERSFQIQIQFTAFEFDGNSSCNDYLEMWDGRNKNAQLIFKSCARSLQDFKNEYGGRASFTSSGNVLFLMMTTDDNRPRGRGFSATYSSIPELATTTDAIVVSTSPNEKRTTVDKESTTQAEILTTTPIALSSLSTTVKSTPPIPTNTLNSISTEFLTTIRANPSPTSQVRSSNNPSLQPTPPSSSSFRIVIVAVSTVSFVLLLISICGTGFFIHKRSSRGKTKTSQNNHSIHGVGTSSVRTIKEQSKLYSTTLYYKNESFHASPQGMYPPPYQSKNDVDDMRSSRKNTRILPSEGPIGDVAYESCDGEEKRNCDYAENAGEVMNIAYETYNEEKIVNNGDYASNVGEVENTAYESYDGQENDDNGDYMASIGEVSNIVYQSYDGQGKVQNDDKVLHEGETSNVVYESYDRQENSGNSDDTANEEVSNVAYESYDGENNVTYDTDEDSKRYEAIDDSQSVEDDYSKIR